MTLDPDPHVQWHIVPFDAEDVEDEQQHIASLITTNVSNAKCITVIAVLFHSPNLRSISN